MVIPGGRRIGAFQLSMSFIIGIVFAIVLLSLAIFWVQDIFSGFTDISETLKQDASQKLEETFQNTDENFAIWPKRYEVNPGTRIAVTAGIKNNAYDGERHSFLLGITQESGPSSIDATQWLEWAKPAKTVNPNTNTKIPVLITVPSGVTSGTYIFRITACSECREPRCPPGGAVGTVTSTSCTANSEFVWGSSASDFILFVK